MPIGTEFLTMTEAIKTIRRRRGDWIFAAITYVAALLVFLPVIRWIFVQTTTKEQLLHAFVILFGSGALLAYYNQEKLQLRLQHDAYSHGLLLLSFGCIAINHWLALPFLGLMSFCLALAALVRFTFGPRPSPITHALLIAFALFLLLMLTMPQFDWPLRRIAGSWSAWLLGLLGKGAELILITRPEPQLILNVDQRPFVVAPECNGFGIISASILLCLLLSIYRRVSLLDTGLLLIGSVTLAFFANTVRILLIVCLAPHVENYMLMHEVVGALIFYGALALLGWLVIGFGKQPQGSGKTVKQSVTPKITLR